MRVRERNYSTERKKERKKERKNYVERKEELDVKKKVLDVCEEGEREEDEEGEEVEGEERDWKSTILFIHPSYGVDKEDRTFPEGINPKVRLGFELVYYDVDIQHVSHCITRTPLCLYICQIGWAEK